MSLRMELRDALDFGTVRKKTHEGAVKGLTMGMDHILQVSQTLVPNEEGTLERSGQAAVDEGTLTGSVSYSTPYALRQHEELGYRHSGGRTAKYLEKPMTSEREAVLELVAAQMRRALR